MPGKARSATHATVVTEQKIGESGPREVIGTGGIFPFLELPLPEIFETFVQ